MKIDIIYLKNLYIERFLECCNFTKSDKKKSLNNDYRLVKKKY